MLASRVVCESHRAETKATAGAACGRRVTVAAIETDVLMVAVRDAEAAERRATCRSAYLRQGQFCQLYPDAVTQRVRRDSHD